MATVKYATTCDICGERSAEYASHPTCCECLRDVCPAHVEPGTLVVDEGQQACWCKPCAAYERYASDFPLTDDPRR